MRPYLLPLLLLVILLVACGRREGIEQVRTNNQVIEVELLFEHEGCKIYRFYDGRYGYYTKCGDLNWSHTESCGKNCNKTVETQNTVEGVR